MFRAQSNIFDDVVVKATDENLTSENWEYILVRTSSLRWLWSVLRQGLNGASLCAASWQHDASTMPISSYRASLTEYFRMFATKSALPTQAPKMPSLP